MKKLLEFTVEAMEGIHDDFKFGGLRECQIYCRWEGECKSEERGPAILHYLGLIIVGIFVGVLILVGVIATLVVLNKLNKSKGR